jgi:hypothetical protein
MLNIVSTKRMKIKVNKGSMLLGKVGKVIWGERYFIF